jgi:hypothetical protein
MAERDGGDSHADFLASVGTALSALEGVDTELAKILQLHLITATPADDCVAAATAALVDLAEKRASARTTSKTDV